MIEHNFKKQFGQNFITDKNLLCAIAQDGQISSQDDVLEIGAGWGSLTQILSQNAKKVVSYEIDRELEMHLKSLAPKNTTFVFGDILKFSLEEIEKPFEGEYKLVANLPYYISSPIILKFLPSKKLNSLTIMLQKEVAARVVATPGSKDYGLLSVICRFYGQASICRIVSKNLFHPMPKVDSAVVNIKLNHLSNSIDGKKFYDFLTKVFAMRRKTLKNNLLQSGIDMSKIALLPAEILKARAEELDFDTLKAIYLKIFE